MSRLLIGRKSLPARRRGSGPPCPWRARSPRRPAPAPRRRRTPASNRCASAAARRYGFLSLTRAAEIVAEVLAHLRIRVVHAVLVVLRRDRRERVGLVAVALEIAFARCARTRRRNRPECPLLPSGSWPSAGCRRPPAPGVAVIFSTPITRAKRPRPAARKSRAPCIAAEPEAQAFSYAGDGLEAQFRQVLQHQRGREILRREAVVEQAEEDRRRSRPARCRHPRWRRRRHGRSETRCRGLRACRTANAPNRRCRLRSWDHLLPLPACWRRAAPAQADSVPPFK